MRCQIRVLVNEATGEYVRCDSPGRRCLTRGALIALALHLCNGHAVALDAVPTNPRKASR